MNLFSWLFSPSPTNALSLVQEIQSLSVGELRRAFQPAPDTQSTHNDLAQRILRDPIALQQLDVFASVNREIGHSSKEPDTNLIELIFQVYSKHAMCFSPPPAGCILHAPSECKEQAALQEHLSRVQELAATPHALWATCKTNVVSPALDTCLIRDLAKIVEQYLFDLPAASCTAHASVRLTIRPGEHHLVHLDSIKWVLVAAFTSDYSHMTFTVLPFRRQRLFAHLRLCVLHSSGDTTKTRCLDSVTSWLDGSGEFTLALTPAEHAGYVDQAGNIDIEFAVHQLSRPDSWWRRGF
jgi:hypothetical protein